jgi:hypothetical protein
MKAPSTVLILGLLAGAAACSQPASQADGNNSLTPTANSAEAAPIANDSETANAATGKPVGGDVADPAAVDGPSTGEGPGDKPAGEAGAAAGEPMPEGDKPQ